MNDHGIQRYPNLFWLSSHLPIHIADQSLIYPIFLSVDSKIMIKFCVSNQVGQQLKSHEMWDVIFGDPFGVPVGPCGTLWHQFLNIRAPGF